MHVIFVGLLSSTTPNDSTPRLFKIMPVPATLGVTPTAIIQPPSDAKAPPEAFPGFLLGTAGGLSGKALLICIRKNGFAFFAL